MEKKPATKQVVRTVREHVTSAAKDKAAQLGVKTKETVKSKAEKQLFPEQDKKKEQSAESYASDQITEEAERAADGAVVIGGKAAKATVRKIKEKRSEKKKRSSKQRILAHQRNPTLRMPQRLMTSRANRITQLQTLRDKENRKKKNLQRRRARNLL